MPNASSKPTVTPITAATADTPPIATTAMLVVLSVSQWQARKHEKKVSAEVAEAHGTHHDAGRYHKVLIARGALAEIVAAANKARSFHYANTLPWLDNGARVLPSANYMAYTEAMRALRVGFDAEVSKFVASYPDYVADARVALNGLFSDADYPNARQIVRRFNFDFDFMPLPTADDFRVALGDREQAKIRADIEDRVNQAVQGTVAHLWERIYKCVATMAENLKSYQPKTENSKASNVFRDSTVQNIRELVDLLPGLNLTGDVRLHDATERMRNELCGHDADQLRDDDGLRTEVAQSAQDILASMAGYCS